MPWYYWFGNSWCLKVQTRKFNGALRHLIKRYGSQIASEITTMVWLANPWIDRRTRLSNQRSGQPGMERKMSRTSLVAAYYGICTLVWYIMHMYRSELGPDGYMVRFWCDLPRRGQERQPSCCLCRTRSFIFLRLKSIVRDNIGLGILKSRHFQDCMWCLLLFMGQCRASCQVMWHCLLVLRVQLIIWDRSMHSWVWYVWVWSME